MALAGSVFVLQSMDFTGGGIQTGSYPVYQSNSFETPNDEPMWNTIGEGVHIAKAHTVQTRAS